MAQAPPPYSKYEGYPPQGGYAPQTAYVQQPQYNPGYAPGQPYPQGYAQGYGPQQPQVIYVERERPQPASNNDWWLTSLLALCCGCFLGEVCCDSPCLCCGLPCPLPRWR